MEDIQCYIISLYFFKYPLGLFDCNENKTPELIRLLKTLSVYVPCKDGEVVESVFFGGLFYIIMRLAVIFLVHLR